MKQLFLALTLVFSLGVMTPSWGQISVDRSVQLSAEFQTNTEFMLISWSPVNGATGYEVGIRNGTFWTTLETLTPQDTSYLFTGFEKGKAYELRVKKDGATPGYGYIQLGHEVPYTLDRGHCLLLIESSLTTPLENEINQWLQDAQGDGWAVDTMHIEMDASSEAVRIRIQSWNENLALDKRSVFILGHVPVPYAGEIAPDGHGDHNGAWPADVYYAEMNGSWTDTRVNNVTARDARNHNIPGDGKWDNSTISTDVELEVGRVDLINMPAFSDDYIELTRQYLQKNHDFKVKAFDVQRRGLVENNFASFGEGFGQNGWKNFAPMFGRENVIRGNYEVDLENEDYLFAYACGAGSYTSMGGVGSTNSLYVEREIKAVFVMNFGSYFGDWDRTNNLMRAALCSGTILTNAWAARPNWQFHPMALGENIGYCAKISQNNGFTYESGFGGRSIHVSLLGDPTLRLHPVLPISNLSATANLLQADLTWDASADASEGYIVLRKKSSDASFELLTPAPISETTFTDSAVEDKTSYDYMVKVVKLETSASGTYYNTSIGQQTSVVIDAGLPDNVIAKIDSARCHDSGDGKITLSLDGGIAPFSYEWSNGDMDSVANDLIAGEYTVMITSGMGAEQAYGPYEVLAPIALGGDVQTTPSTGTDGTAMANITGGTPPYNLQWGDGTLNPNMLPPGMYTLTVTDKNNCEFLIDFEVKMATSIDEYLTNLVMVYPNPFKDRVQLSLDEEKMSFHIRVMDAMGKLVMTKDWDTSNPLILDLGHLPNQVYYIHGSGTKGDILKVVQRQ